MRSVNPPHNAAVAPARVVVRLPLTELWRDGTTVGATRGPVVGEERIRELLRGDTAAFAVANIGEPLRWYAGAERFAIWKSEFRARLVPPGRDGFRLEEYPDERCYVATEWAQVAGTTILVFECHH